MTEKTQAFALSVIVPVYNGAATLAEQLEALSAQQWERPWEVLVVNNASTDATAEIAAEFAARSSLFRVAEASDGHNLSYVRNVGVGLANGRSVAFCDADDVIADGWVAAIGEALETNPLVGSRLEYERLNMVKESGASRFGSTGFASMFGYPLVTGAGMGCQVSLWDALGGNDESWDATGEDFEFSIRAVRDRGAEPYFVEDAVYHYRLREDTRSMFRQNRRYGRSHARLYKEFGSREYRSPIMKSLRHDAALLWRLGDLRHPSRRVAWARSAGKRLGRLEGSVRYRTLYL